MSVSAGLEHPFFVFGRGWASCDPHISMTKWSQIAKDQGQRTWHCFSQVQPCLQPAGPRGRVHLSGSRRQAPPDCWPWGQSQPATARWWPAEKQPRSKTGPSGPGGSHKATLWIQSCHLSQQWDSQQSFKTASISTNSKSGQLVKVKHHLALLTSFPESFYHQP